MSTSKDTNGSESGADGSRKGRFTVKFATGRRQSEDPEIAASTSIQELPSSSGKESVESLHISLLSRKKEETSS